MERADVEITVAGVRLAAWHYPAGGAACVVMGHGFSLTRHDGLDPIARRIAAAGLDVVAFDQRFLGDSGGEPRQSSNLAAWLEDWQATIAFARGLPGIERVALWGYSLGGGNAVRAAARDGGIAALVLVCPMSDGRTQPLTMPPATAARIAGVALGQALGRRRYVGAAGRPGELAVLTAPGDAEGFAAVVPPGSPWRNRSLTDGVLQMPFLRPVRDIRRVDCPVWLGIARQERTVWRRSQLQLARRARRAEVHHLDGDHYTWMGDDAVIASQVAFLQRTA